MGPAIFELDKCRALDRQVIIDDQVLRATYLSSNFHSCRGRLPSAI